MSDIVKIHFDTEFNGLKKNTDLISIALICEYPLHSKAFYAEVKDFETNDEWVKENVIDNLFNGDFDKLMELVSSFNEQRICNINNIVYVYEPIEVIARELIAWLEEIHEELLDRKIQFVSDSVPYDWVILVDLISNFSTALDIPKYVIPYCHDINQDIAEREKVLDSKAFDINREEYSGTFIKPGMENLKHNALWDAMIIKRIDNNWY